MYQGSDEWLETSMLAEYAEGANAYGVFLGGDNKLFKNSEPGSHDEEWQEDRCP